MRDILSLCNRYFFLSSISPDSHCFRVIRLYFSSLISSVTGNFRVQGYLKQTRYFVRIYMQKYYQNNILKQKYDLFSPNFQRSEIL